MWKGVSPHPQFAKLVLTPFPLEIILEALREAAQDFTDDESWLRQEAKRLHSVTEGLPALLDRYINWMQKKLFMANERIEGPDCFNEVAKPYIENELLSVDSLIPFGGEYLKDKRNILRSAILKLSTYRCITQPHLESICEEDNNFKDDLDAIGWSVDALWNAVRDTHLIEPKDVHWREVYRPIRRLLFQYQFPNPPIPSEPNLLAAEAHRKAAKFYDNWWNDESLSYPPKSMLVWEYIWHYAECFRLSQQSDGAKNLIKLTEELFKRVRRDHHIGVDDLFEYLEDRINGDDELHHTLTMIDISGDLLSVVKKLVRPRRKGGR
jgi:hypothetical protein